jgi:hypothetical protein
MKFEGELAQFGSAKIELSKKEAKIATDFLSKLVPGYIREAGGILSDTVRYWRWRNQIKIIILAKEYLDSLNLQPKVPPLKIIVPLIESASLEEVESIQVMWSRLLASALVDETIILPNHILTLKQLNSTEIKILNWMYQQDSKSETPDMYSPTDIAKEFNLLDANAQVILEDLLRLGLLSKPSALTSEIPYSNGQCFSTELGPNRFHFNQFGMSFMKSCIEGPAVNK